MSVYVVLKFIHVLLAITALGANLTYGVWLGRAARQPEYFGHVLRGVKILDDRMANPAYGLLLVTGLAMLYVGRIPWTTPWILTALMLYVGVILLGFFGYTPLLRRQIEALERTGHRSPEYIQIQTRATTVGIVLAVLVVAIVFLMVTKPSLWA